MAARRMVMVLLALLIVSTFVATLVPPPDDGDDDTTTTTTVPATGMVVAGAGKDGGRNHKLVRRTVSADAKRPARVTIREGDELELTVESEEFRQVDIPLLGAYDEVDPDQPAIFNLLPRDAGVYPVELVPGGEIIARINVIHPPAKPSDGEKPKR